jgi:transketolase
METYVKHQPQAPKHQIDQAKVQSCKKLWSQHAPAEATRRSSAHCLSLMHEMLPNIIGGSADLTESNFTKIKGQSVIGPNAFMGNYIHWGVREHSMAAMMNGIALYDDYIPYGGTFLVFSDYLRPALRLSALMKLQVIYIMTHDSIGVGEDGPTHQPVEQLASLRAIPNLTVMRPCDRIETLECWQVAMQNTTGPSLLCLSRQTTEQLRTEYEEMNLSARGAYILHEYSNTPNQVDITIFASGTEVSIAKEAAVRLFQNFNKGVRLVSVPSLNLFSLQATDYQTEIMCNHSKKIAIEAGCRQGWDRIIGPHGLFFGIDGFGKSAPADTLYQHFGLSADNIVEKVMQSLLQ